MSQHLPPPIVSANSLSPALETLGLNIATTSAAAARAVSTPELLDIILSHLLREELPPTALVSRFWLEIGRDHIWRHVENPHELFGLLAPVKRTAESGYVFERIPSHNDWTSFRTWASRVRSIVIQGPLITDDSVMSLLSEMARTEFCHPLLPNLQTLIWVQEENMEQLGLFTHAGLESLYMCLPPDNANGYPVETICQDIASKASSIRRLSFMPLACISFELIAIPIANLLLRLSNSLEVLEIPVYGLTRPIFEAASHVRSLKELAFTAPRFPAAARYQDVLAFTPCLEPNSFLNLESLSVSASLDDLNKLLLNPNFPSKQLDEFNVRAVRPETSDSVQSFHRIVARQCTNLADYCILLSASCDDDDRIPRWPIAPAPNTALGWDVLAPLTALRTLKNIYIAHDYALICTTNQLADFARCLPALECLSFNPSPRNVGDQPPLIKLAELGVLVDAMPSIETLELYVDATGTSAAYTQWTGQPFALLESMWLSASPVNMDARTKISLFLASVMPVTAHIDTHTCALWDYVAPAARHIDEWDIIAEDVAEWLELLKKRIAAEPVGHS